ncbi:MAG: hypothetical protein KatS3mg051_1429 [Anaerolineae bacterium]|nr:MAG: hypothetical protein KatS3mg051_1429 [Anaerolineae bacterium]
MSLTTVTATPATTNRAYEQKCEWLACSESPLYFTHRYLHLYDAQVGEWIPFRLWPAQARVLKTFHTARLVIVLKARQIGMTWLALAYALWLMLFHPAATVLLFSRRDDEAVDLLDFRLKGLYVRLPAWLRARAVVADNAHEFALSNGSRAMAFPTTAGDSYTASLVIADEFDLVQDQDRLMAAVKPTIDNGGQMILLSRPDKSRPQTRFKQIYRAAKEGLNDWRSVFLPWSAHPGRDAAWYARMRADIESATGALDELHEQYPATDAEALAPRTLDKRIAAQWLEQCFVPLAPLDPLPKGAPSIPGLRLYCEPRAGLTYVGGVDPAEGNPTSDDSALTVRCRETGEEVASLSGKFQPATLAAYADAIGRYFNDAALMVERNNHGHAVLLWLRDNSRLRRLWGFDGREGWHSTVRGKALLYDAAADFYRNREGVLHTFQTFTQLASIEGSTLRAPDGEKDDLADSDALSIVGLLYSGGSGISFV